MKTHEIRDLLRRCAQQGRVSEPEAKHVLSLAGLAVPELRVAKSMEEAIGFAERLGYPVVAKAVSPLLLYKSDRDGVEVGVEDEARLSALFQRFARIDGFSGMLVEEMVSGLEISVGASRPDALSPPLITLCKCGPGSQVCRETKYLKVPVDPGQAESVLKTWYDRLFQGEASPPTGPDLTDLVRFLVSFSRLVEALEDVVDSINLNPVICSPARCVAVDVRISLNSRFVESEKGFPPDTSPALSPDASGRSEA